MKNWFRVVLWEALFAGFAVLYAGCYLPILAYYYYGVDREIAQLPDDPIHRLHQAVILLAAVIYAGIRVYGFHPAFSKDYWTWLKQTPWRNGLPLPRGPVHLVPQDVAIVGVLSGLAWWHFSELWWVVPCAFLAMYLICMMTSFIRTGFPRHAYLLMFGLAGTLWFHHDPIRLSSLLGLLYVIALHGLNRCLDQSENWDWKAFNERLGGDAAEQKNRQLGWPFDLLGPRRNRFPVSQGWAIAIAVLAGWWVFSVASVFHVARHSQGVLVLLVCAFGVILAVGRLGKYVFGYAPPISIWGRFATNRWIIPQYDVVFAAPVLILVIVSSLKWLVLDFHVPLERALPAVAAAYVYVAMGFPPSLDEWRLTGNHRIVAAVNKQTMQQIP